MQYFDRIVDRLRAAGCVYAEDEAQLLIDAAPTSHELFDMVDRRVEGHPLEHVLGWTEFCGLRIAVGPGVFVPRPRTELLASEAARLAFPGSIVVDLCCGAGAIGAVVADRVRDIRLYASDIDPVALEYARWNIGAKGQVLCGDLVAALPVNLRGHINVLVANTPYVPTAAIALMPPEARDFEPLIALDGGEDGLDIQRRIAAEAATWLAPGGMLLVEAAARQAAEAARIFESNGLTVTITTDDEMDATVVIGTNPQQDAAD